ncbi:MAG: peptidoglycan-binding protein, partial [bacterium]
MNLQDRNLSRGIQGEDVKLLQSELRQLGHEIADAEVAKSLFGETTLRAVIEFQKSHGLSEDGIVGENTAKELSVAIAGLQDSKNREPIKTEPKKGEPKKDEVKPPSNSPTKLPPSDIVPQLPPNGDPKLPTNSAPSSYVIQGQIRQTDEEPAVGLIVRAFDKDAAGRETKLGESVSDQDGLYKITYPEAVFSKLSGGRNQLDMVLRVFDQTHNMNQGWNVVHITKPVETLEPRVVSWLPWKMPATPTFSVSGNVLWFDNRPAANVTVRAFDRDLRNEEELGQTVTDKQGHYQINY